MAACGLSRDGIRAGPKRIRAIGRTLATRGPRRNRPPFGMLMRGFARYCRPRGKGALPPPRVGVGAAARQAAGLHPSRGRRESVRPRPYADLMPKRPSRIDLLELDI